MLERAAVCLETGGRHVVRRSKQALRTRRMLHSSFWHHGAGDLDLPPLWTTLPPQPTADAGSNLGSRLGCSDQTADTSDQLFLDFLYPQKTLAYMQRLNVGGAERKELGTSQRSRRSVRARRYSSAARAAAVETNKHDDAWDPSLGSMTDPLRVPTSRIIRRIASDAQRSSLAWAQRTRPHQPKPFRVWPESNAKASTLNNETEAAAPDSVKGEGPAIVLSRNPTSLSSDSTALDNNDTRLAASSQSDETSAADTSGGDPSAPSDAVETRLSTDPSLPLVEFAEFPADVWTEEFEDTQDMAQDEDMQSSAQLDGIQAMVQDERTVPIMEKEDTVSVIEEAPEEVDDGKADVVENTDPSPVEAVQERATVGRKQDFSDALLALEAQSSNERPASNLYRGPIPEDLRYLQEIEKLEDYLVSSPRGERAKAWRLYQLSRNNTETDWRPSLAWQIALMKFLCASDTTVDWERVMAISEDISSPKPDPVNDIAMDALIKLGKIEAAIELYRSSAAGTSGQPPKAPKDGLVQAAVAQRLWQDAVNLFSIYMDNNIAPDRVITAVADLPDLPELALRFLTAFEKDVSHNGPLSEEQRENVSALGGILSVAALSQTDRSTPLRRHQYRFLGPLLDRLPHGLRSKKLYEVPMFKLLDDPADSAYTPEPSAIYPIYWRYIQKYLQPSKRLLYKVLQRLIAHDVVYSGSKFNIDRVAADWRSKYGSLSLEAYFLLLNFFSERGEVKRTEALMEEFLATAATAADRDRKLAKSLLYVIRAEARCGNVEKAESAFHRLEQISNPNTAHWQALLDGYRRKDDLAGAKHCFDRMLKSGVELRASNFRPLLEMMSKRGNVAGILEIFQTQQFRDANLGDFHPVYNNLMFAHINNEDAKSALQQLDRVLEQSTLPKSSLTPMFNMLMFNFARRGDVSSTQSLFTKMHESGVPLNGYTYGSLMHALVKVSQPDPAYKILRDVMPKNRVRTQAHHWAIVMAGYFRVGAYAKVMLLYQTMLKKRKPGNMFTKLFYLRAKAVLEGINTTDTKFKEMRLPETEATLEALLDEEEAMQQVMEGKHDSSAAYENETIGDVLSEDTDIPYSIVPIIGNSYQRAQNYVAYVVMRYAYYRNVGAGREVFERFLLRHDPLTELANIDYTKFNQVLLKALMNLHEAAQDHPMVEKLWRISRDRAYAFVDAADGTISFMQGRMLGPEISVLLDSKQRNGLGDQATAVVEEVQGKGFELTSQNWNHYIRCLLSVDSTLRAFRLCEEYLTPNFSGWRTNIKWISPKHDIRSARKYMYNAPVGDGTKVFPYYSLCVLLLARWQEVRRRAALVKEGDELRREIEATAPMTLEMLRTMPRTDDVWQRHALIGEEV